MVYHTPNRKGALSDTIAAIATPAGRGGISIVRVSGSLCFKIAKQVTKQNLKPRYANFCNFYSYNREIIDQGIALYFPAPQSFTGEDTLEFHTHGSPIITDNLLDSLFHFGARFARPGEFSERAFLNDKIDLSQAEAIADLIESTSLQAARNALSSLQGEFSKRINLLREQLIQIRCLVEASIDFSDEDIGIVDLESILNKLQGIQNTLKVICDSAQQGVLFREGIRIALIGRPNVGKSSLYNKLVGKDAAIVTQIPGTTRDILCTNIVIEGLAISLIDTAGLRESTDIIELEGIRRARKELDYVDHILLISNHQDGLTEKEYKLFNELPKGVQVTLIFNKIDLDHTPASIEQSNLGKIIRVSALTGAGIDLLIQHLKETAGFNINEEGGFSARRRHLNALHKTEAAIELTKAALVKGEFEEIIAEELRQAQNYLGEITGRYYTDDLLGEIFSTFCIGK
ncbi:tRNA uridine-5-carboxymethylaminomethyl(34) synthesis GTPase MnmE [Candidatus Nitrosacidococcus sp. I8]|uniref:tRNA uridine-5-carboxymethylaminomethyl(34) synthesis GTPase MnmE n=1 Tax=Candidatus Nitrosacidococcus sp. I8 TaxID=2942908 RepID=UPI002227A95F|nr:tRNA uridine-5-carboxymethylaminomethyl(34) synthesis GTPase MnmE [Candidatus Nitrosacidococcus sp. I8]CAH9019958.1 tRNA modification GTPase MnmE [Candidatus Nitrosacidococcus sp. I8]